jgi:hypothetical protein
MTETPKSSPETPQSLNAKHAALYQAINGLSLWQENPNSINLDGISITRSSSNPDVLILTYKGIHLTFYSYGSILTDLNQNLNEQNPDLYTEIITRLIEKANHAKRQEQQSVLAQLQKLVKSLIESA